MPEIKESVSSWGDHKDYIDSFVALLDAKYAVPGKTLVEIGPDHTYLFAEKLLTAGAKKIHCFSPDTGIPEPANPKIILHRSLFEYNTLRDNSIDGVLAVATLEHMEDVPRVVGVAKRLLKPGGFLFLQGGPIWTGPRGHHAWITTPDGRQMLFLDKSNPFQPWEHLSYESATRPDLEALFKAKGYSASDAAFMTASLLDQWNIRSNLINGLTKQSPTKIIAAVTEIFKGEIEVVRETQLEVAQQTQTSPNEFFDAALASGKYSREDLWTDGLQIYAVKAGVPGRGGISDFFHRLRAKFF